MKKLLLSLMVIGLTFASCKKNQEITEEDNDVTSANDNTYAESTYNDIDNMSDEAGLNGSISNYRLNSNFNNPIILGSCAIVTYDSLQYKLTIDFGTGCNGKDLKNRSGKIIISYDKPSFKDSLCTKTITFDNYYVNNNKVEGTKTVKYLGHINGNMTWEIKVVGGKITFGNNGGTITWDREGKRTLLAGELNGNIDWKNSIFQIEGNGSGTRINGKSYTYVITTPLIKDFLNCSGKHFVKGVFELTPSGKLKRTIDYGNGACDDDASVTIGNKTYQIKLK